MKKLMLASCILIVTGFVLLGSAAAVELDNLYAPVLDFFYQAISEDWDGQRLINAGLEPYGFPNDLSKSGYFYWDINSDGIEELFVYGDSEQDGMNLLAGYTLIDNQPVRLFAGFTRSCFYLCNDGSIYGEGSNGAAYSVNYIYELKNNSLTVREGVLSGDYESDGKMMHGWFLADESADFSYEEHVLISKEDALSRISGYQSSVMTCFDNTVTFAQYAGQEYQK